MIAFSSYCLIHLIYFSWRVLFILWNIQLTGDNRGVSAWAQHRSPLFLREAPERNLLGGRVLAECAEGEEPCFLSGRISNRTAVAGKRTTHLSGEVCPSLRWSCGPWGFINPTTPPCPFAPPSQDNHFRVSSFQAWFPSCLLFVLI